MADFNKVILAGRLTRDVETRQVSTGTTVGTFGLAISRRYRTREGESNEETTFVDCEAWKSVAETLALHTCKGSPLLIEGRLKLDQWQDQQGNNRSKLKVVVEGFQFLGDGKQRSGDSRTNKKRQMPEESEVPF